MSYQISLMQDNEVCDVLPHHEGCNIAIGGTTEASLSVTWNYCCFYYWFLDKEAGIKWLFGKKAGDTIARLETAVHELCEGAGFGGNRYEKDYWASTPGNAGHALKILLEWAKQYPNAMWVGC